MIFSYLTVNLGINYHISSLLPRLDVPCGGHKFEYSRSTVTVVADGLQQQKSTVGAILSH